MEKKLTLISTDFFQEYSDEANASQLDFFKNYVEAKQFQTEDFEYYIISSSLYSSKIEGNSLDANSFFRNRDKKTSPKKKEVQEIESLVDAYRFASKNALNRKNFLKSHALLSKTLLPAKERGVLRNEQVGVRDSKTMKPVYLAVEPDFLETEFNKLFDDIDELLSANLDFKEVCYFASMIHLWIALIHPFTDGNGRSARLLEKWFLASKLGMTAWTVDSEKYYWDNRPAYYQNIVLGFNYYALHWNRCLPFLLMLPDAIFKSV